MRRGLHHVDVCNYSVPNISNKLLHSLYSGCLYWERNSIKKENLTRKIYIMNRFATH